MLYVTDDYVSYATDDQELWEVPADRSDSFREPSEAREDLK